MVWNKVRQVQRKHIDTNHSVYWWFSNVQLKHFEYGIHVDHVFIDYTLYADDLALLLQVAETSKYLQTVWG